MTPLKLEIELIPSTCWYSNVRTNVPKQKWDVIRKKCYQAAGYKCEICGGVGEKHPVECHEIWEYSHPGVDLRLQKLVGFIALCPTCHRVKHLGRVQTVEPHLAPMVIAHFIRVNQLTTDEAIAAIGQSYDLWRQRSQHTWELDISYITPYIDTPHAPVPV